MTKARDIASMLSSTQTLANKTLSTGSIGSGVTGLTGVKNCDTWRITSNFQVPATGSNYITANLEKEDTGMMSQTIGTGMTESSGVFSFPSIGLWLVLSNTFVTSGTSGNYAGFTSRYTRDNSSYSGVLSDSYTHVETSGHHRPISGQGILDVTDISNVKMKFEFYVHASASGSTIAGSIVANYTNVTFIRIGDT